MNHKDNLVINIWISRNLRKEVVSKAKYYFLDNGIRNAIVSQFNPLDSRNDIGLYGKTSLLPKG